MGQMHSFPSLKQYKDLSVQILPALEDNYMYLVYDNNTKQTVIVDPCDAKLVSNFLKENPELNPVAILATHHHWDHVGGIIELQELYNNKLKVYGGDERIEGLTETIQRTGQIKINENLDFKVLFTPCHTTGHVCFYNEKNGIIFTGDTLFITGCGRFFEGTGEQMNNNLNKILSVLPDETNIFCGHEYTTGQIKFAQAIEPSNKNLDIFEGECSDLRSQVPPRPTIPGNIGQEKLTNPFMRLDSVEIQQSIGYNNKEVNFDQVMTQLRRYKDNWSLELR